MSNQETSENWPTREERALNQLLEISDKMLSEPAGTVIEEATKAAYAECLVNGYCFQSQEYEEALQEMRRAATEISLKDHDFLTELVCAGKAAAASVSTDDDTLVGHKVERRDVHWYYRMTYGMIEEILQEHREHNEDPKSQQDFVDDNLSYHLVNQYQPVFLEREGIARVLGEEHPVAKLMERAVESMDAEELAVALAAYEALPEHIVHRIHHPWVGHPPPSGTRERLREEHAPELVGEGTDREPVGCYLQIDARKAHQEQSDRSADDEGYCIDPAIVYDLRTHDEWPVRIQIAEGSDKEVTLRLLKKAHNKLEQEWEELTDAERYLRPPEGSDQADERFADEGFDW